MLPFATAPVGRYTPDRPLSDSARMWVAPISHGVADITKGVADVLNCGEYQNQAAANECHAMVVGKTCAPCLTIQGRF